jgi:hypothetical protein
MLKKMFLIGILLVGGILVVQMIPKKIANASAEFLIIYGIIAFILMIAIFGFKPIKEKLWWENGIQRI